jgi:hypothetical protein
MNGCPEMLRIISSVLLEMLLSLDMVSPPMSDNGARLKGVGHMCDRFNGGHELRLVLPPCGVAGPISPGSP